MTPIKIKNIKFNRLTPIKIVEKTKYGNKWLCKCDCGNYTKVLASAIKGGRTKSCGCYVGIMNKERSLTHGMSYHRIYNTFAHIQQRCNNKNNKAYKYYGDRGIKCLWDNFEEFKIDMYESYLEHEKEFGTKQTTIDRIDNDGNYCKENCRWSDSFEQQNNTRNNNKTTFNGITKNTSEWAKETGIKRVTIHNRLFHLNWSVRRALTEPVNATKP